MRTITLLALLLTACTSAVQAQPTGTLPAATSAPTATATSEPSPTPDLTAIAAARTEIDRLNAEAAANLAAVQLTEAQRLAAEAEAARIRAEMDQAAQDTAGEIAIRQAERERLLAEKELLEAQAEIRAEQQRLDMAWWRDVVLPAGLGALGILLAFVAFLRLADAWNERTRTLTNAPASGYGTLQVRMDRRDEYGWGAIRWSELPIDQETLVQVAQQICAGSRFTQAQMTGAGRPLIKGSTFEQLGDWMVTNGIAEQLEDGRYVIRHIEFFEEVNALRKHNVRIGAAA